MSVSFLKTAIALTALGFVVLVKPPEKLDIHYFPFSWETFFPLRRAYFDGHSYDVTSLFRPNRSGADLQGDLLKALGQPGPACRLHDGFIRLHVRGRHGRELWVDTDGCREGNLLPDVSGRRLVGEDFRDLRRALMTAVPPHDSF